MKNKPNRKYPYSELIPLVEMTTGSGVAQRNIVARSRDQSIIFARRKSGDIVILTDDQTIVNKLPKREARALALWILNAC